MWFNIVTENHGDTDSAAMTLAPLVRYLRFVLGSLGHDVTAVYDQIYPQAINLYIENFRGPRDYAKEFRELRHKHGVRIGVVATELITGGTIPYDVQGVELMGASASTQKALMTERVSRLDAVVGEVDFLWSFLKRTADEYCGRCRLSAFLPVGFSRDIPAGERRGPRDIDIFFFGRATSHRAAVINGLAAEGLNVVFSGIGMPGGWKPDYIVDSMLDRARIGLNLTLQSVDATTGPDPRFASCFRVKEMLERGVCIVSEEIPLDNPYRGFMTSASVRDLAGICRSLLQSGQWQEAGQSSAARFRNDMNAITLCRPVVEQTLSALGR